MSSQIETPASRSSCKRSETFLRSRLGADQVAQRDLGVRQWFALYWLPRAYELLDIVGHVPDVDVHTRKHATFPEPEGDELPRGADDALMAVLGKLGDFRGESRFTTWAYKFALLEAAVKVRRRAWQGREMQLEPETWPLIADTLQTPNESAETGELLLALQQTIEGDLTPHQREVLVAITLNDIPIDVLAERLSTTRGALYKTLHDARRRLRAILQAQGLDIHPPVNAKIS